MDKSWIWKKKSTEKCIVADDKPNILLNKNEEETPISNQAELERDGRVLNDKLPSVLSNSNARDELAKKQAKVALEPIAGREMSETKAISMKLELDKALQQRAASEERLIHVDAALKECMQQLRFIREEQEKRIHDAVMKASNEFQITRMELHSKLDEASRRLAKVDSENTQLSKALLMKEKVIEELNKHRAKAEADFNVLMTRLESTEKENASLKYELRVLEKELEIRNEEREFNRRTADVSHKQHLENVKKIAKLESECQRLRLLVRKRLPGPAALAKMKNEVEMLGKDQPETQRRKSNSPLTASMDFSVDMASETPRKQITYLAEQLYGMEEENRTLKQALNKRTNELQFSRTIFGQTASKLSHLQGHLGDHSVAEPGKTLFSTREVSLASMSDMGSDDKVSCAESWASALLSELEQFKNGKQNGTPSSRTVEAPDMSLMDDFVEMEKLAFVAVDDAFGNSNHVVENNVARSPLRVQSNGNGSEEAVSVIIPDRSHMSISYHQYQPKDAVSDKSSAWLEEILQIVLEKSQVLQRNPNDILEEIKGAFPGANHPNSQCVVSKECSNHLDIIGAHNDMAQRPPEKSLIVDSSNRGADSNILTAKKSNQKGQSNLRTSIHKIIELIEGIGTQSLHDGNSEGFPRKNDLQYRNSETSTGYVVRLFQWKTSELSATLEQFVQVCNDLLNGKSDLENFAERLKCTLDWIMNHCFSLQDVSSMKDAIKNHLDWDDSRSESELDSGTTNHFLESNKMHLPERELTPSPLVSIPNCRNGHFQVKDAQPHGKGEDGRLKDESPSNKSAWKDLEGRLQAEILKSESLMIQLQESHKKIESLQKEVETPKQLKETIEDQSEKHKMVIEDLEMQLIKTKTELSKACEKLVYLEKELENKNNSSEKLDPTCHELHLQLESFGKREIPDDEHTGRQLRTESEIATASEKLAECQETILNLGKQLKALASPSEAALFDKVVFSPAENNAATVTTPKVLSNPADNTANSMTTPEKKVHQRSSLLDRMLAEDGADIEDLKSPETKETFLDGGKDPASRANEAAESLERLTKPIGVNHHKNEVVGSLAVVPSKKKKGARGFLRKLLGKVKKNSGKKNDLLIC